MSKVSTSSDDSRGLLVLGMHRSGTSAVASILETLGLSIPGETVPPAEDNPRGYFEPLEIVNLHNDFLLSVHRTWSDPRPIPSELFASEHAESVRRKLPELLDPTSSWLVKDPRLCRLLPLWSERFESDKPRILFVLRSPLAVAASLGERDGFPPSKSLLLWLRHLLEAEAHTRELDRRWLSFEGLLESPDGESSSTLAWAVGGQATPVDVARAVADHLDRSLVHQAASSAALDLDRYPWVAAVWKSLASLVGGVGERESDHEVLDRVRRELERADRHLVGDPSAWAISSTGDQWSLAHAQSERLEASVAAQRQEIDVLRAEIMALLHRVDKPTDPTTWAEEIRSPILGVLNNLDEEIVEIDKRLTDVVDAATAAGAAAAAAGDATETVAARHRQSSAELAALRDDIGRVSGWAKEAAALRATQERSHALHLETLEHLRGRDATLLEQSLSALLELETEWIVLRQQLETLRDEQLQSTRAIDRLTHREFELARQVELGGEHNAELALENDDLRGERQRLTEVIERLETDLRASHEALASERAELEARDRQSDELQTHLEQLRTHIEQLEESLDEASRRHDLASEELDRILGTRSWRWTQGVRRFVGWTKGGD